MKRSRLIKIFVALAIVVPIVWIAVSQQMEYRSTLRAIEKLASTDVERVLVYEGEWPKGASRTVEDPEKITLLVTSLKSGKKYSPNHDQHNGFERVVILEPQQLQFRVYQKKGDPNHVIVGLGEWTSETSYRSFGHIECVLPKAWIEL